jgi:hypothetical protein
VTRETSRPRFAPAPRSYQRRTQAASAAFHYRQRQPRCHKCGQRGHIRRTCPHRPEVYRKIARK